MRAAMGATMHLAVYATCFFRGCFCTYCTLLPGKPHAAVRLLLGILYALVGHTTCCRCMPHAAARHTTCFVLPLSMLRANLSCARCMPHAAAGHAASCVLPLIMLRAACTRVRLLHWSA
uniref:Uncharacterized protein n=1 Tax=Chlamydomonas euryale TaxID=1486919 RepID=A0A7R9Z2R9_9CHLO